MRLGWHYWFSGGHFKSLILGKQCQILGTLLLMADSFFEFNTSLTGLELDDAPDLDEEEYDALNHETFGDNAFQGDWEADHTRFAEVTENSRLYQNSFNSDNDDFEVDEYDEDDEDLDLETSLSQLVLEDGEDDAVAQPATKKNLKSIINTDGHKSVNKQRHSSSPVGGTDSKKHVSSSKSQQKLPDPIIPRHSLMRLLPPQLAKIPTVQELERDLIQKNKQNKAAGKEVKANNANYAGNQARSGIQQVPPLNSNSGQQNLRNNVNYSSGNNSIPPGFSSLQMPPFLQPPQQEMVLIRNNVNMPMMLGPRLMPPYILPNPHLLLPQNPLLVPPQMMRFMPPHPVLMPQQQQQQHQSQKQQHPPQQQSQPQQQQQHHQQAHHQHPPQQQHQQGHQHPPQQQSQPQQQQQHHQQAHHQHPPQQQHQQAHQHPPQQQPTPPQQQHPPQQHHQHQQMHHQHQQHHQNPQHSYQQQHQKQPQILQHPPQQPFQLFAQQHRILIQNQIQPLCNLPIFQEMGEGQKNSSKNNRNIQGHSSKNHLPNRRGAGDYDEYAGLMSIRERIWLRNIQLIQLTSDRPHLDDYYYNEWLKKQEEKVKKKPLQTKNGIKKDNTVLGNNKQNDGGNRNRKDGDRDLLSTPARKTYVPLQFENSLGKLQCLSFTAPRKIIDVDLVSEQQSDATPVPSHRDAKKTKKLLLELERLYLMALEIEEIDANIGLEEKLFIKPELVDKIITSFLNENRFVNFMCIRKGKVLLLRTLKYLNENDHNDKLSDLWCRTIKSIATIVRRDQNDGILLQLYPYFKKWINSVTYSNLSVLTSFLLTGNTVSSVKSSSRAVSPVSGKTVLSVSLASKFGVSVITSILTRGEVMFPDMEEKEKLAWGTFIFSFMKQMINVPSLENIPSPLEPLKPEIVTSILNRSTGLQIQDYATAKRILNYFN